MAGPLFDHYPGTKSDDTLAAAAAAETRREASCWPQTVQEGTEHSFGHFSGECAPRYFSKIFGIVRITDTKQCRALSRSQPCVSSGIEETDLCPWSVHESKWSIKMPFIQIEEHELDLA